MLIIGLFAGFAGALFGLGGGIIIVPALTLVLGLPIGEAIGTSLVSIMAVSTFSAADFLKAGRVDLELGLLLAVSASIGALTGGLISGIIPANFLYLMFAIILLISSLYMARPARTILNNQEYRSPSSKRIGFVLSFLTGNVSGMLGAGGGIIYVPMMRILMNVPMKIATATSSYMIGITVTPAAILYLMKEDIDPFKVAAIIAGTFFGSRAGAFISYRITSKFLRILFVCLMLFTAYRMFLRGI